MGTRKLRGKHGRLWAVSGRSEPHLEDDHKQDQVQRQGEGGMAGEEKGFAWSKDPAFARSRRRGVGRQYG